MSIHVWLYHALLSVYSWWFPQILGCPSSQIRCSNDSGRVGALLNHWHGSYGRVGFKFAGRIWLSAPWTWAPSVRACHDPRSSLSSAHTIYPCGRGQFSDHRSYALLSELYQTNDFMLVSVRGQLYYRPCLDNCLPRPDLTLEPAEILSRDFEVKRVGSVHMCPNWKLIHDELSYNWNIWTEGKMEKIHTS